MKSLITITLIAQSFFCAAQKTERIDTKKLFEYQDEQFRAGSGLMVTGAAICTLSYFIYNSYSDGRGKATGITAGSVGLAFIAGGSIYVSKSTKRDLPKTFFE